MRIRSVLPLSMSGGGRGGKGKAENIQGTAIRNPTSRGGERTPGPNHEQTQGVPRPTPILLVIAICALLQLCDGASPCLPEQIYYKETKKCCYPVFNCPPGTEVSPCSGTEFKDTCTKCKRDMIQPQLVSSLDGIYATCFSNQDQDDECITGELLPAREQTLTVCGIPCTCNSNNCYFGDDPCRCNIKEPRSCPKSMTMNNLTGDCEPCPKYTFKDYEGCGPCYYNETEWLNAHRNGSFTAFPPSSSSKETKPASTKTTVDAYGTSSTTDSDVKECPKESTVPPYLIAILVVLALLVIVLFSILAYVIYKQRRNPPHQLLHQVIGSNGQGSTPIASTAGTPTERNATFSVEKQRLILRDERPIAPIQPTHHPVHGGYNSVETNGLVEGEVCNASNVC